MTERVRMSFKVKQFPNGKPWICPEPVQEDLVVLANGFLGFDLPPGTTIEKTKKIAEFLEENIVNLSYTNCILSESILESYVLALYTAEYGLEARLSPTNTSQSRLQRSARLDHQSEIPCLARFPTA